MSSLQQAVLTGSIRKFQSDVDDETKRELENLRALTRELKDDGVLEPWLIQKIVGEKYRVTVRDIRSRRRKASLVRPRHIAIWLTHRKTALSLPTIGRQFNRDHTSVLHAINRIDAGLEDDASLREQVNELERKVSERIAL